MIVADPAGDTVDSEPLPGLLIEAPDGFTITGRSPEFISRLVEAWNTREPGDVNDDRKGNDPNRPWK